MSDYSCCCQICCQPACYQVCFPKKKDCCGKKVCCEKKVCYEKKDCCEKKVCYEKKDCFYGDGSAGSICITSNVDWSMNPPPDGNYMFYNFTIKEGAVLTLPSGTKLRICGNFTNNGTINVASPLPGQSLNFPAERANSLAAPQGTGLGGVAFPSQELLNLLDPGILGGGNGGLGVPNNDPQTAGGSGGGVLSVYVNGILINTGIINANGGNAIAIGDGSGPGGGAGGIIILVSKMCIQNTGTIRATGGTGGNGISIDNFGGGGGAGGLVRLLAPNANSTGGTINVVGGNGGINNESPVTGNGGGGGAMGGNGGNGGNPSDNNSTSGQTGLIFRTTTINPECLF